MSVSKRMKELESKKIPRFKEKYEEQLREELFKDKLKTVEDGDEKFILKEIKDHCKRPDEKWDVPIGEEIIYFDNTLSYEITHYRPITMDNGLDFDSTEFTKAGRIKSESGKYTEYRPGSKSYNDFWVEQKNRCMYGFEHNGYKVTGDHYFFLNFYRMLVHKDGTGAGEGRSNDFPMFHSKQYEFFHYLDMCQKLLRDCCLLKGRGIGFSEIMACLGVRPFITNPGFRTVYTTYQESQLDPVLTKCWLQLNWLNRETDGGFRRLRQKIDQSKRKRASLVDSQGDEYGSMAEIEGIVGDKANKIRGDRADRLILEEFGSNKIGMESYVQAFSLIDIGGNRIGIRIAGGTGGDSGPFLASLSKIFNNPKAYEVLPFLNRNMAAGKNALTGFFIPSFEFSLSKKYLDNRGVTDEIEFKKYYTRIRSLLTGQDLLNECAEHCFSPEEALLREGENMFDSIVISDRLTRIRLFDEGVKPERASIIWDHSKGDGKEYVKVVPNKNSNILIYEHPITDDGGEPYKNLYVAGIDSIDQGTNDSATQTDVSDFCLVIKKRLRGINDPAYVCIYKERPADIRTAYYNTMKLLIYYNCKAMLEHTKISILSLFKSEKKDKLFFTRPKSTMSDIRRGNSKMIGVPASEPVIKHCLELINDYINDYCHNINSEEMLEELLRYNYVNKRKFDIIAAMGMCELGDEELGSIRIYDSAKEKNEWKDVGYYKDSQGILRHGVICQKKRLGKL